MPRLILAAACTAWLALGCGARADTVSIHGSTTVSNAVLTSHKADIERASGETLDVVANGSGRGLADLVAGKADMAMISAPLESEVAATNAKTPGSLDPTKLVAHQIGQTRVAFVVNPSNPVKSLTIAQIAGILSGKTVKWSEVGGADQPIVVVAATRGDGVRSVVEGRLLAGASFLATARELPNAPQIVQVVGQLPNAFGVTAAGSLKAGVTALMTDETIGQPLILVTMGPASAGANRIIDAMKAVAEQ
jgi:phosphate transport system substrate-binding protein